LGHQPICGAEGEIGEESEKQKKYQYGTENKCRTVTNVNVEKGCAARKMENYFQFHRG